jgi:uncharacterized protein (DUF2235 family)
MTNAGPPPPPRRLVLCLDGTWNSAYDRKRRSDGHSVLKPTNVLKLSRAVLPRGTSGTCEQIAFYDIGVGSIAIFPGIPNRLLHLTDKVLGGVWGAGYEANVENALSFLVLNYQAGDQVFLFGFSRGAATARGLTHFLDWAGGLPSKSDAYYLPQLFREFVVSKGQAKLADVVGRIDRERAEEKRQPPSLGPFRAIDIEFLGVWDTVMALGSRFQATGASTSPVSQSFYIDREPAACVKHARQALAIDEARYDFRPEIWAGPRAGQTLEQRWFAGVHSNVGGGYVHDGLANLAFHWILDGAAARGLEIDRHFAAFYRGFAQDALYRSDSWFYRILDALRFRRGQGKRSLAGKPATANLSLDPSVIHRIAADPGEHKADGSLRFPNLEQPYRPENVLLFLACQPDLDQYLWSLGLDEAHRQLRADVLRRIGELRRRCGRDLATAS